MARGRAAGSHQVGMEMPFVRSKVAKLDIALAHSFLRNFEGERERGLSRRSRRRTTGGRLRCCGKRDREIASYGDGTDGERCNGFIGLARALGRVLYYRASETKPSRSMNYISIL